MSHGMPATQPPNGPRSPEQRDGIEHAFEWMRQAAYDTGYLEGAEVAREDFAAHLARTAVEDVRAALAAGDLRDLTPRSVEMWARARRTSGAAQAPRKGGEQS